MDESCNEACLKSCASVRAPSCQCRFAESHIRPDRMSCDKQQKRGEKMRGASEALQCQTHGVSTLVRWVETLRLALCDRAMKLSSNHLIGMHRSYNIDCRALGCCIPHDIVSELHMACQTAALSRHCLRTGACLLLQCKLDVAAQSGVSAFVLERHIAALACAPASCVMRPQALHTPPISAFVSAVMP